MSQVNENKVLDWVAGKRYRVNQVVKQGAIFWRNSTGINTNPTLEDGNWDSMGSGGAGGGASLETYSESGTQGTGDIIALMGDFLGKHLKIDEAAGTISINISADDLVLTPELQSIVTKEYLYRAAAEAYEETGTIAGGDLIVRIGDPDAVRIVFDQFANTIKILDRNVAVLTELITSGFATPTTGVPNTDPTLPGYRTGNTGFGEPNPVEKVHGVGSFKFAYTYANGVISRVQLAGENIGSEVGYPAGNIKGQFITVLPAPGTQENTDSMNAAILLADVSDIGQPNLVGQVGVQNNLNTRYANVIGRINNLNNYYQIGLQVFNSADNLRGWARVKERGETAGYDKEPIFQLFLNREANGTHTAATASETFMTPNEFRTNVDLISLIGWGDGVRIEGYVCKNDLAATGTAATILKAAKYALNIDEDGSTVLTTPLNNSFITGYGAYHDNLLAPNQQTITSTPSILQINGLGAETDTEYLPKEIRGISQLWDSVNDKITPISRGDFYTARVGMEIFSKTGAPTRLDLTLDIGVGAGITVSIVQDEKSISKNEPFFTTFEFTFFSKDAFLANGGRIFLNTDTGTTNIRARNINLFRTSKGEL
jgi:hypothetical protein